jgi:hypothetical protein
LLIKARAIHRAADRGCPCNAPAVEKLAERAERKRQYDREYSTNKRAEEKKPKENNAASYYDGNDELRQIMAGLADVHEHV